MVPVLKNIKPNGRYSPRETWEKLGIGKTTLYKYDKAGFISHETLPQNGRRCYRGSAIIAFHEGQKK